MGKHQNNLTGIDLDNFKKLQMAAIIATSLEISNIFGAFGKALGSLASSELLVAALEQKRHEERWKHDPLELKQRLGLLSWKEFRKVTAKTLRTLARQIDV